MSKLDNILKGFTATLTKLDKLIASNNAKSVSNAEAITIIMDINAGIKEETKRAKRVQVKLQELLG
jgi:hypothetical protein